MILTREESDAILNSLSELAKITDHIEIKLIKDNGLTCPPEIMNSMVSGDNTSWPIIPETGLRFDMIELKLKHKSSEKSINLGTIAYQNNKFTLLAVATIGMNPLFGYCQYLNNVLTNVVFSGVAPSGKEAADALNALKGIVTTSLMFMDAQEVAAKESESERIRKAHVFEEKLREACPDENEREQMENVLKAFMSGDPAFIQKPPQEKTGVERKEESKEELLSQLKTIWMTYKHHLEKDLYKDADGTFKKNADNQFDKITLEKHHEVIKLLRILECHDESPKKVLATFKTELEKSHRVFSQSRDPWYIEVTKQLVTLGFINLYRHLNKGHITRGDEFFHNSVSALDAETDPNMEICFSNRLNGSFTENKVYISRHKQ